MTCTKYCILEKFQFSTALLQVLHYIEINLKCPTSGPIVNTRYDFTIPESTLGEQELLSEFHRKYIILFEIIK